MMISRQTITFVVAAVLSAGLVASHGYAYQRGKAAVQAKWDAEKARVMQAALKAEREQRAKEHVLQEEKRKVEVQHAETKKKAASDAAAAQSELERLRDTLAARDRAARQNSPAERGTHAVTGLERELLGHCASSLVGMAKEADRLEGVIVGLQGYVKNVCLR
jgi:vancomycin resistance protein YoaR